MTENTDKQCDIKYEKLKLHIKYISGISIAICALVITISTFYTKEFVEQVSFAGTISSIILSVIAIIMTIAGETKADNAKDRLINTTFTLQTVANGMKENADKVTEIGKILDEIKVIQCKLEEVNDGVDEIKNAQIRNILEKNSSKKIDTQETDLLIKIYESWIMYDEGEGFASEMVISAIYFIFKFSENMSDSTIKSYIQIVKSHYHEVEEGDVSMSIGIAVVFCRYLWENEMFKNNIEENLNTKCKRLKKKIDLLK